MCHNAFAHRGRRVTGNYTLINDFGKFELFGECVMNFRARRSAFKDMHSRIPGPLSGNGEL